MHLNLLSNIWKSWVMDPVKFGQDLARKAELTYKLADENFNWPDLSKKTLVFTAMGSSAFAAQAIVTRLQNFGHNAIFSLASNPTPPKASEDKVLIAISATGSSAETKNAFENASGFKSKIWLTNSANVSGNLVQMHAGAETGEVASLTYLATQIALLKLCEQLGYLKNIKSSISLAAEAIEDISSSQQRWLPDLISHIKSPNGTYFIAPHDRFCNAQQSALMMRECPRLPAVACETGDWSHIDVYLTKSIDYRAILFPGSIWEEQLFKWTTERKSKVATIGFENKSASLTLRYKHDRDPIVRLLAEITFVELIAQKIWLG